MWRQEEKRGQVHFVNKMDLSPFLLHLDQRSSALYLVHSQFSGTGHH